MLLKIELTEVCTTKFEMNISITHHVNLLEELKYYTITIYYRRRSMLRYEVLQLKTELFMIEPCST